METYKLEKEHREVMFKLPNGKVVVKICQKLLSDWGNKKTFEYYIVEN